MNKFSAKVFSRTGSQYAAELSTLQLRAAPQSFILTDGEAVLQFTFVSVHRNSEEIAGYMYKQVGGVLTALLIND